MNIFVFAPESNRTNQLVHRLRLRGYNAGHASPRLYVGNPPAEAVQRHCMRAIAHADAVAVPDGAITPEQLSRLLVVCEFAGVPVVRYEDLPGEAPADGQLPAVLDLHTRVCMVQEPTPDVLPERTAARVRALMQRAATFFDHGRWLKNPNSRAALHN